MSTKSKKEHKAEIEYYKRWLEGEVKAECARCGVKFGPGGGDFFDPIEKWLCYDCLDEMELEIF